jgi:hypothetical protein
VPIARLAHIDAVEAFDGAVALEGGVFSMVRAFGSVFMGGVFWLSADVAAGVT